MSKYRNGSNRRRYLQMFNPQYAASLSSAKLAAELNVNCRLHIFTFYTILAYLNWIFTLLFFRPGIEFGPSWRKCFLQDPLVYWQERSVNHLQCLQYWSLLNWQNLRLHCGCVAVPVNWFFDIISSFFVKFKNVVHSLEPDETPSNSASYQAPNYVQYS